MLGEFQSPGEMTEKALLPRGMCSDIWRGQNRDDNEAV